MSLEGESRNIVETALAGIRESLDMEVAYITEFVDGRQLFRAYEGDAASFGIELDSGPAIENTYCRRMLAGLLPNIVPDAQNDERVLDLPATKGARIGAYVGVPLHWPSGANGTLCCLSHGPRPALDEHDVRLLLTLGKLVSDHLHRDHVSRVIAAGEMSRVGAELHTLLKRMEALGRDAVLRLSRAIEFRDDDTGAHIDRVGENAKELAIAAGFGDHFAELMGTAATLHDVGKVAIPDSILLKPGRLDAGEWEVMRSHAEVGYNLLRNSPQEVLDLAASIALTHHEWIDGTGYPNALRNGEIPPEGRIVAITDVFDALTHPRVYREPLPTQDAIDIMRSEQGHLDQRLLDVFVESVVARAC